MATTTSLRSRHPRFAVKGSQGLGHHTVTRASTIKTYINRIRQPSASETAVPASQSESIGRNKLAKKRWMKDNASKPHDPQAAEVLEEHDASQGQEHNLQLQASGTQRQAKQRGLPASLS